MQKNSPPLGARLLSKLNGLIPSDSFAEPLNLPLCLLRPGSTLLREKRRASRPQERLSRHPPYLGYPLFPLHKTLCDRTRYRLEFRQLNRASLNAARGCLNVVDTFRFAHRRTGPSDYRRTRTSYRQMTPEGHPYDRACRIRRRPSLQPGCWDRSLKAAIHKHRPKRCSSHESKRS